MNYLRICRNFQRGYKINAEVSIIPNLKYGFPNQLKDDYWKSRKRVSFPQREKQQKFSESTIWLDYMKDRIQRKNDKKQAVLEKRKSHNKSLDGLTCKQRRNQKRKLLKNK